MSSGKWRSFCLGLNVFKRDRISLNTYKRQHITLRRGRDKGRILYVEITVYVRPLQLLCVCVQYYTLILRAETRPGAPFTNMVQHKSQHG